MAEKLTQFSDDFPIANVIPSTSKASSYEAGAKLLGGTAQAIVKIGEGLKQEESAAMLMQSHAQVIDVTTKAKEALLANPQNADAILADTKNRIDAIKGSASVSKKDRAQLDYYATNSLLSFELQAATTTAQLNREVALVDAYQSYPAMQQTYSDALMRGDEKAAKDAEQTMFDATIGYVKSGVLTGVQATNKLNEVRKELSLVKARMEASQNPNTTAAQFHTLNDGNPNIQNNLDKTPFNATSEHIAYLQKMNLTEAEYKDSISHGIIPPPQALTGITDLKVLDGMSTFKNGASEANGLIVSGESFPNIQKEIKRLEQEQVKTVKTQGKLARLKTYVNEINNGQVIKYINNTPLGAKSLKEYQGKLLAINAANLSEEERNEALTLANKQRINDIKSISDALEIPMDKRAYYSQDQVDQLRRDFFSPNGNSANGISLLATMTPDTLGVFSEQIPDKSQSMAVYNIGMMYNKVDKGLRDWYIQSLRPGINYSNLITDKNGMSDNKIKDLVLPKLSNVMDYLAMQPDAQKLTDTLASQAVAYVKYRASMTNDYNFSNAKKYAEEFQTLMSIPYTPVTTFKGTIDTNNIKVSKLDVEFLSAWALDIADKKLQKYMNEAEFDKYKSQNPLSVRSTSTGKLTVVDMQGRAAVDKDGRPLFDEVFNQNMVTSAYAFAEKREAESVEYRLKNRGRFLGY